MVERCSHNERFKTMDAWTKATMGFFTEHSGSSMATLMTKTLPKVNKTNGKRGNDKVLFNDHFNGKTIYKLAKRYVGIGHRYATGLQNRLDKEETGTTYKPEPRKWGERIGDLVLFTHNESVYLEYFYFNANSAKSTSEYVWDDGTPLTESELHDAKNIFNLDPKKSVSKKQADLGLTDDNNVIINVIKIENVLSVKAFGHTLTKENVHAEIAM
jgi:hypothetical protein